MSYSKLQTTGRPESTTALRSISVVIITQDEEDRVGKAIQSCQSFADEIVVVDGGSRDRTPQIAQDLGCQVYQNPWPGYAKQRNFGAERAQHSWIFFIDSDEFVGDDLAASLLAWKQQPELPANAFAIYRIGDFLGQWLTNRGGYLVRLYNRDCFKIKDVLVHEEPDIGGAPVVRLPGTLWHQGFRSITDHVQRFDRYTSLDAQKRHKAGRKFSLLRLILRPQARFFQKYILHGLYRKGISGLAVACFWSYYEFLQEIKLYELNWKEQEQRSC